MQLARAVHKRRALCGDMATFEMSDREERALSPAEMCDRLEGMMCNLDDARAGAASLRHYLHRLSQLVCAAWGDEQGSERIRALRARATALIVDAASRVGQLKGDEALEVRSIRVALLKPSSAR